MPALINMEGRVPGTRLTVIASAGKDKHGNAQFLVQCDCGSKPKIVLGRNLRNGTTKSCGCLHRETASQACIQRNTRIDLVGRTFGRWTVVARAANNKYGHTCFLCECSCPRKKRRIVSGNCLLRGHSKSCGCLNREKAAERATQRNYTNNPVKVIPFEERFWSKVDKNGPMPTACAESFGNCWIWTGLKNKQGYGSTSFTRSNRHIGATHASWFIHFGAWPDKDMLHVCDNPSCVRPTHLFEGTDADNSYDAMLKRSGAILIQVPVGPLDVVLHEEYHD